MMSLPGLLLATGRHAEAREVLELVDYQGMRPVDVAEMLEIEPVSVRANLFNSRLNSLVSVVFGAFVLGSDRSLKLFGFGLAVTGGLQPAE